MAIQARCTRGCRGCRSTKRVRCCRTANVRRRTMNTAPDRDDDVDEALMETFPASDPAANTVATGVRIKVDLPGTSEARIRDHREASRLDGGPVAGDHQNQD